MRERLYIPIPAGLDQHRQLSGRLVPLFSIFAVLLLLTGCEQKPSADSSNSKNTNHSEPAAIVVSKIEQPLVVSNSSARSATSAPPAHYPNTNLISRPAGDSTPAPAQTNVSLVFPRPPVNTLELQVALVRSGISCGSIDGLLGPQTRSALEAFQKAHALRVSGSLDDTTRSVLILQSNALSTYLVKAADLARLQSLSETWVGKSRQTALDYTNIVELVAEKSKAHPKLLKELNPNVQWESLKEGDAVTVPAAEYPTPTRKAALVRIALAQRTLEVFDSEDKLLAHFPCSIARMAEKRPVGELHVTVVAPNPNYTFDPALFPESPEARTLTTKLVIPPGPNNPVGTVWIGLDRPGYGIHGTPNPEQVGRTESHGCFRLANWNAEYLLTMVTIGTTISVEP